LVGTRVEKMEREEGDGGGIIGTIGNGREMEIEGEREIEECKREEGNGGGMMIPLSGTGKITL
jgi:hypothetical protein